jgi:hypothetical protein
MLVGMISLFWAFIPNIFGQTENVEVLSYSWYVSSLGNFIVVGEVQNVGSSILQFVDLQGIVYTTDGEARATAYASPYSAYILPQQKAPFIFYFRSNNSYSGNLDWISTGVDRVEFSSYSVETEDYLYPDLEITDVTDYINSNGFFTVSGNVRNTGDQTTGHLWVVATFYNSTGSVISIGFSYFLTDSLLAGQTTSFTFNTVDSLPELSTQITDYELSIQTDSPIIPEFPSWIILPLFLVVTLIAVIVKKRLSQNIS